MQVISTGRFRPGQTLAAVLTALIAVVFSAAVGAASAQESSSSTWFETDALRVDGGSDEILDQFRTPRGLISKFLDLTEQRDYGRAAAALHPGEREDDLEGLSGAQLARMLAGILHRRVVIDWGSLADRPDGMNVNLPSNHPFAGKPRRNLVIGELNGSGRPITISISRYKPEGGEAVWLFSPETVANIPRMHALFEPGWLMVHIPEPLRMEAIGSVRLWEIIALPLVITAFLLLVLAFRKIIEWAADHMPVKFIARASRAMRTPLAIAISALVIKQFLDSSLSFSSPVTAVVSPLLLLTIIFSLTLAILRTIDTSLALVTDRYVGDLDTKADTDRRHLYTNIYAARRYVLLVAVVVTIILFLLQLNLFDSIGMSLLASAGVATVVLGIAGQTVLGNLLASLQIAIAKPIRIGDAVQYEGKWCYVEAIFYTYITLRAWDSRRLIVPVKYFISQPFENWTMTDTKTTRSFVMELDLSADPQALREVFEEIVQEEEHLMPDEMLMVTVEGYSQTTQKIQFYATADNPSEAWTMNVRLCEKMGNWVRENHPEWWSRLRLVSPDAQADDAGETRNAAGA
ncbi:mechanosensitive ion channel [Rhodobacterales bacterium]|nr:mechanosensitive ion channel [Rhodobacterales bacterium]